MKATYKNVIPAKAGIQFYMSLVPCFRRDDVLIPTCAGMTDKEPFQKTKMLQFYI